MKEQDDMNATATCQICLNRYIAAGLDMCARCAGIEAAQGTYQEEAKALRAEAQRCEARAEESFQRCDTDGFLSQWASGLHSDLCRARADIAEQGGRCAFPALFNLQGELVAAKFIETRYGWAWGILPSDDPTGSFVSWFNPSNARSLKKMDAADARKGFYVGSVLAHAAAKMDGRGTGLSGSAWVARFRTDGGFSRDVEVLDNGTTIRTTRPDPETGCYA